MSWNVAPADSRQPSASDTWRKTPGKKDTKRWCKGKPGREHTPVVERDKNLHTPCKTAPDWALKLGWPSWSCYHQLVCSTCKKILEYRVDTCPDLPS